MRSKWHSSEMDFCDRVRIDGAQLNGIYLERSRLILIEARLFRAEVLRGALNRDAVQANGTFESKVWTRLVERHSSH